MHQAITGIQQVGIGVTDADEAKLLYKELFGMDVLLFDDKAEANLMTRYTGNQIHRRRAILSLNINGGGGFEIWQFLSRSGVKASTNLAIGDLGIFGVQIKAKNITAAHDYYHSLDGVQVSAIKITPANQQQFWVSDQYNNHFNIIESDEWFKLGTKNIGGVAGAVIGVSNMDKALQFYQTILGINEIVYDVTAPLTSVPHNHSQGKICRQVLLKKHISNKGAFSKLLGSIQLELIEAEGVKTEKIYGDRYWGDCGFIHLCFDVLNMNKLKALCKDAGYEFTVDSANSFAMGSSSGRFCYVEDPDGTLIELVETHRVPIFKKFGWYLDLKKRKDDKRLPGWMINLLALNKVR